MFTGSGPVLLVYLVPLVETGPKNGKSSLASRARPEESLSALGPAAIIVEFADANHDCLGV